MVIIALRTFQNGKKWEILMKNSHEDCKVENR